MKRVLRIACLIVLCLGIFVTIYWWLSQPLWSINVPETNCILGFTQDERSLVMSEGITKRQHATATPRVLFRDIHTGNDLRSVEIKLPTGRYIHQLKLTRDCKLLFAQAAKASGGTTQHPEFSGESSLYIFEMETGALINRVEHFGFYVGVHPSRFGKWYWHFTEGAGATLISVCKYNEAEPTYQFRSIRPDFIIDAFFSEDETKLALLKTDTQSGKQVGQNVQLIELTTGQEIKRVSISVDHNFSHITGWSGEAIYLQTESANESSGGGVGSAPSMPNRSSIFRIDLNSEVPGRATIESHLDSSISNDDSVVSKYGRDWVIQERKKEQKEPQWLLSSLAWLDKKCDTHWVEKYRRRMSIVISDRITGDERFSLSVKWNSTALLSDSGKYLAVYHQSTGLQLWNTLTSLRCPLALCGMLIPIIIILSFRIRHIQVQSKRLA